ncbi:MAG: metalloregulator ArsR/SmtB family transcription factor [Paenibacillaceae bacterium]|uniref:Metalloregulator ArsR/SmtB family transcription factor n=1 Tax=Paenibacillus mellifer TaxID=2937794 RepID=A0A9X1Y5M4_9BACL|nr:metalloregulator ArsR/SmtB family transcription factor [Paenibacillus mellifer]MBW4838515.1 metalloregulator ArsR/SmtB family transcription factor [Paenibacillaceae bacterium]MCK8490091.1 metalloregulator ArsR/SmtB family transcription factor [Paenibacillus mellifer]
MADLVQETEGCETLCTDPSRSSGLQATLEERDLNGMVLVFKALSDPNRVKIAYYLQHQELCVCDIAALLEVSVATASHHLRQLKAFHIAKSRKVGKNVYYSLSDHHIQTLVAMTLEHQKER